mmetsp:Transcript_1004/g.2094  ORF Transcript_1004/g.2094 Transcript_1004/m.2094 type:complete len:266 (-) Transcript_1004:617-1414(-)
MPLHFESPPTPQLQHHRVNPDILLLPSLGARVGHHPLLRPVWRACMACNSVGPAMSRREVSREMPLPSLRPGMQVAPRPTLPAEAGLPLIVLCDGVLAVNPHRARHPAVHPYARPLVQQVLKQSHVYPWPIGIAPTLQGLQAEWDPVEGSEVATFTNTEAVAEARVVGEREHHYQLPISLHRGVHVYPLGHELIRVHQDGLVPPECWALGRQVTKGIHHHILHLPGAAWGHCIPGPGFTPMQVKDGIQVLRFCLPRPCPLPLCNR